MQTFLPYPDFRASAETLDNKRLGKQRVETYQLLTAVTGFKLMTKDPEDPKGKRDLPQHMWRFEEFEGRWNQHLAARMWIQSAEVLLLYGITVCEVWKERGYNDTCLEKMLCYWDAVPDKPIVPPWLGDDRVHQSHRSNLIRKSPAHYSPQFPDDPDDLEYIWPLINDDGDWVYQRGPTKK